MTTLLQVRAFFTVDLIITLRFWYVSLFTVGMSSFYYVMLSRFIPPHLQQEMTLTFVILATLGVCLFHFSSRVSMERVEAWSDFVRTLPTPLWVRFAARLLLVLAVAGFASMLILAVGAVRFDLEYGPAVIGAVVVAVLTTTVVFAPIAACVGGLVHPRFAPAMMTVIYLTNTWLTGVWSRGVEPAVLGSLDFLLPPRAIRDLVLAVPEADWTEIGANAALAGVWMFTASSLAWWIHSRDEGETY